MSVFPQTGGEWVIFLVTVATVVGLWLVCKPARPPAVETSDEEGW